MKGRFLLGSQKSLVESNIYANKSSLVLDWILQVGIEREKFSIREVAKDRNVSIGLVQKVFRLLALKGILITEGIRTSKKFIIKKPELLIKNWLNQYNIVKKCKMWTYRTGFEERKQALKVMEKSDLQQQVVLALHSAAEAHGYKNTNLQTIELYLLKPDIRPQIEEALELEPQERGYKVLLIEPYYKSMLNYSKDRQTRDSKLQKREPKLTSDHLLYSPPLLTFLDLYHFPLRGREQAEYMGDHIPELNRIYKTS